MVGRELANRFFEDRTRPRTTVRPSIRIRDLDRVLRHVVRMRRRQVPHRLASTPRDVSDQAFPSLSNFYCVLRCACGEGLGTRLPIWGELSLGQSKSCTYIRTGVHLHTCIPTYVPRPTTRLRLHERCSNSAGFTDKSAGFAAVCFWSRKCPKHSKKVTVRRDWDDAGNRTATSVLEKRLTRETEGGVVRAILLFHEGVVHK